MIQDPPRSDRPSALRPLPFFRLSQSVCSPPSLELLPSNPDHLPPIGQVDVLLTILSCNGHLETIHAIETSGTAYLDTLSSPPAEETSSFKLVEAHFRLFKILFTNICAVGCPLPWGVITLHPTGGIMAPSKVTSGTESALSRLHQLRRMTDDALGVSFQVRSITALARKRC